MIDLHCHLLPGIDDGPDTMEGSLHLAAEAAVDGIETIAATPHFREDHPSVRPEDLAVRCADVAAALQKSGSELSVVPAAEVDLLSALETPHEQLRLATYGQRGTDVLVECPYGPLTSNFEQLLFNRFTANGMRVLLAHPERNPTFQNDPARLAELVRRGVLVQVTAGSLLGSGSRSSSRRMATALVKEGVAHVIASDSHGAGIARGPLSAGLAEAARYDPRRARWMVTEAPAAILTGEPLPALPEPAPPRRRWLPRGRPR